MLRKYVSPIHLALYFTSIVITWLEAIITPALVQYIVESFTNFYEYQKIICLSL